MQNEIQLLVQITAAHVRATALGLYTTQNSSGVGIGFPVHPPPPPPPLKPPNTNITEQEKGKAFIFSGSIYRNETLQL